MDERVSHCVRAAGPFWSQLDEAGPALMVHDASCAEPSAWCPGSLRLLLSVAGAVGKDVMSRPRTSESVTYLVGNYLGAF